MQAAKEPGPRTEPASDDRYRFLRELGHRAIPTYAAVLQLPAAKPQLVVAERLAREGRVTDEEAKAMVRDARAAATLHHANIVRTRDVVVRPDDVIVASDFLDGELLSSLLESRATALPLAVCVRALLDVLTGLGRLHDHRDPATQEPLRLFHGELTASSILLGVDGVARVLRACRIRRPRLPRVPSGNTLAPEVFSGGLVDHRADIYSVGALLWESLSEDARWATPLADVAKRAMSVAPAKRYPTAIAMAEDMRQIVGAKMITIERAAMLLKLKVGERVAQRLEALVDASASPRPVALDPVAPKPAIPKRAPPTPAPPVPPPRETLPTPPPLRNSEPALEDPTIVDPHLAPSARRSSGARVVVGVVVACVALLGVAAWRYEQRAVEASTPNAPPKASPPLRAPEPATSPQPTTSVPPMVVAPPAPAAPSAAPSSAPPAPPPPSTSARPPPPPTFAPPPRPRPPPPPRPPGAPPKFDPTRI